MSKKLLFIAIFLGLAVASGVGASYLKTYALPDGQSARIYANALDTNNVSLVKFEEKVGLATTTCYIAFSDRLLSSGGSIRDGLTMSCVR